MPNKDPLEQNFNTVSNHSAERPQTATPEKSTAPGRESTPETLLEKERVGIETKDGFLDEAIEGMKQKLKRPKKTTVGQMPQVRDELTAQIEGIMEEGLNDAFKVLPKLEQQEFKIKGEQTAKAIRELLKSTHVKVKKVFRLLLDWLKMLPGINRFFLEQEAKIKTDKIIALKRINPPKK